MEAVELEVSTRYFKHLHDGTCAQDGCKAKSLQGIAIGWCKQSNGLLFYSPHSKEIYQSSDYKLGEGRCVPASFNLKYDGGLFVGLYNGSPNIRTELFPEGAPIIWSCTHGMGTVGMWGSVRPRTNNPVKNVKKREHFWFILIILLKNKLTKTMFIIFVGQNQYISFSFMGT